MRVIAVGRAEPPEPPEPPEPSTDVARGWFGMWRYLDKPVCLPRQMPGPYRWRVSRPDPRAVPIRVQRVAPPDWDDPEEDQ